MIFFFIGPPGAGKTTILSEALGKILNFSGLDIAKERIFAENDTEAWKAINNKADIFLKKGQFVLIESSGLSEELWKLNTGTSPTWIIKVTGKTEILSNRLQERAQKQELSLQEYLDELSFLDYSTPLIAKLPANLKLDTSILSIEEACNETIYFLLDKTWLYGLEHITIEEGGYL